MELVIFSSSFNYRHNQNNVPALDPDHISAKERRERTADRYKIEMVQYCLNWGMQNDGG